MKWTRFDFCPCFIVVVRHCCESVSMKWRVSTMVRALRESATYSVFLQGGSGLIIIMETGGGLVGEGVSL